MSEDYKFQVTYNTPPAAQYQKGDMLNIRAQTADELASAIEDAKNRSVLAPFFGGIVRATIQAAPAEPATPADASTPTDDEAQAAIARHLGAGQEEPATPVQVTMLVKRFGLTEEEAKGLSKTEAAARMKK